MDQYLRPTEFFDFEHPLVQTFARDATAGLDDPVAMAQALYLRTRDDFRYDPYSFTPDPKTFRASHVIASGISYCIPKAVLLGAAARAVGIPSRLGLADVINHISEPRFVEKLRSQVFAMHGYIELYLEGKWVKATPAFNAALCHKMQVDVLEFNGRDDSIFQAYDTAGRQFMQYLKDYGQFEDVPHAFIIKNLQAAYPHLKDLLLSDQWIARD
ncbi:transglutaminase-like domain-containing protein [Oligoflexus tunisiensis]|uniref:transglutaminase-like domain-containing protein n=1 Tax=Oligoflexus tunisiensis TaxID=708132 RepID=UPI000B15D9D9|nr:transglutaminase family protein [Oligoflexus tunisiensis]